METREFLRSSLLSATEVFLLMRKMATCHSLMTILRILENERRKNEAEPVI